MDVFKNLLIIVQQNPLFGEGFGWIENLSIIAVMGTIIWWLNDENKKLKEDVKKVVEAHQTDLKESNKDLQTIIDRYNAFANEIKDLVSPRK
jgi:hypothetical protein